MPGSNTCVLGTSGTWQVTWQLALVKSTCQVAFVKLTCHSRLRPLLKSLDKWQLVKSNLSNDDVSTSIGPWEMLPPPKSTKSRLSNSLVQIQTRSKFQFQFVPRNTEESEFLDLMDFGGVAFSAESVIFACVYECASVGQWVCGQLTLTSERTFGSFVRI